jgi:hypothetical protein
VRNIGIYLGRVNRGYADKSPKLNFFLAFWFYIWYKTASNRRNPKMEPMPLKRRRPGRPKVGEGGRTGEFVGFRCPAHLKAEIEKAAAANGRSVSTECQFRLAQSFVAGETLADATRLAEQTAYGKAGTTFLRVLRRILRARMASAMNRGPHVPLVDEENWLSDPTEFAALEREITHVLERLRPAGDPLSLTGESPENRVDRLLVALKMIEPPAEWAEEDAP